MLKTQVTDSELDGAAVISDNIHSWFNLNWHRLLTGRRVAADYVSARSRTRPGGEGQFLSR